MRIPVRDQAPDSPLKQLPPPNLPPSSSPRAQRFRVLAVLLTGAALWAGIAQGYCTFDYNPWGSTCDSTDSEEVCLQILADALTSATTSPHAIPIYGNFSEEPFDIPHPNDPTEPVAIHRSLSKLGLSKEAVVGQIKLAIARWNQAVAGWPMLYYAGDAPGDMSPQAEDDRPIGIIFDTYSCIERQLRSTGGSNYPVWTAADGRTYRGRVRLTPFLHGIEVESDAPGECDSLDDSYQPRPIIECGPGDPPDCEPTVDLRAPGLGFNQHSYSTTIASGTQSTLIHELGHALGLHHNFFADGDGDALPEAPDSCGLGQFGANKIGLMSYSAYDLLHPRRDDSEGLRALHRGVMPPAWPILHWFDNGDLPDPGGFDTQGLEELTTTVMPTLANHVVSPTGMTALAYADSKHRVRVRTITNGALDFINPALNLDIPRAGQQGRTFQPVAVALKAQDTQEPFLLFVAWTEEDSSRNALHTYWATREIGSNLWNNFGPEELYVSTGLSTGGSANIRMNPPLGATYDPVFDDFVVMTTSNGHRPGFTVIDTAGGIKEITQALRWTGGFNPDYIDPYNAVGAPICKSTAVAGESLCLVPVATEGDASVVGVVTVRRTAAGWGLANEWLSAGDIPCLVPPGQAACEQVKGYGNITLSWNDALDQGYLGFTNERGDVSWMRVDVNALDEVSFPSIHGKCMATDGTHRVSSSTTRGTPSGICRAIGRCALIGTPPAPASPARHIRAAPTWCTSPARPACPFAVTDSSTFTPSEPKNATARTWQAPPVKTKVSTPVSSPATLRAVSTPLPVSTFRRPRRPHRSPRPADVP